MRKKPLKKSVSITYEKGISLIETMISMTIGLTLIGGLMSMYLGSRETDQTRVELIDIEANARMVLKTLRETIAHTGYPSIENIYLAKPFQTPDDGSLNTSAANPDCRDDNKMIVNSNLLDSVPSALSGFTKDEVSGDKITVIFRPDNPVTGTLFLDCASGGYTASATLTSQDKQLACSTDREGVREGMEVPIDSKVYNGFYLDTSSNELICVGSRTESTTPYVVAENIENIQFLYGVTIDDNTQYKNATDVENDDEWESVTSVQVGLLMSSDKDILGADKERTFKLLDRDITLTSKKMLKVYKSTIRLPNRL